MRGSCACPSRGSSSCGSFGTIPPLIEDSRAKVARAAFCGNENTSLPDTPQSRPGTCGTSQNTLDVPTQHGRSVPPMYRAPHAPRHVSAAGTRHAISVVAEPWCAVQWCCYLRCTSVAGGRCSRSDYTAPVASVARAAAAYNATADVCRRDMSVVIRARRRWSLRVRCSPAAGPAPAHPDREHRCHLVDRHLVTPAVTPIHRCDPRGPVLRSLPRAAERSRETPFSTRDPLVSRPDRNRFRGQVSGKSPGIFPPSFGLVSIGRRESYPHVVIGRFARAISLGRPRQANASTCANYRLGGT